MDIWLRVETASGTVVGDGPITTAQYWRSMARIDEAGEFEFAMPASDPCASLLVNKRIVRCYGVLGGAVTELGAGVIEGIETVLGGEGQPAVLRVTGPDILSELTRRSVRDLAVTELKWIYLNDEKGRVALLEPVDPYPSYEATNLPNCYDADPATYNNVYLQSYSDPGMWEDAVWLYVGYDARFDAAEFTFVAGHTNNNPSTLEAQYFDGEGWRMLTLTDGTASGGATFAQDGIVSWTRPKPWDRYTAQPEGNWFWVRFRVAHSGGQVTTDTVRLAEVRVHADQPTTGGVDQIMACAPGDWVRSGYPATSKEAYIQFDGESVLAALIALAEQTGDHFRLSASGRAIDWLAGYSDSGLRAVAADDPVAQEGAQELVLITELTRRLDTVQAISRIIPKGADGLTLEKTTRTAPEGYTLDAANNYIQRDSAYADWGIIEEQVYYPEVAVQQPDSVAEHPIMAANALFDRAYEDLRKRSAGEQFFGLTIAKTAQVLRPGQTIHVIYHEWVDGYHSVDIDEMLDINGTTVEVDESGVHTVGLEVATIDRLPATDESVLVQTIRSLRDALKGTSMRNPMLHTGDVLVGLTGGAPGRVPAGSDGQSFRFRDGMPTWESVRRIAVSVYPGALAADAAPETFLVVPPGWPATAVEWRLHLDTPGASDTTVIVTKNGVTIATCSLGAASADSYVTLSESLSAGDAIGRQITVAGSGAAGLNCALVCEEA